MAYWRIRTTYSPTGENLAAESWRAGVIGIWYGAWMPLDLERAKGKTAAQTAKLLSAIPSQKKLGWPLSSKQVDSIRRFEQIEKEDWVFSYFDQSLHLGRVSSPMLTTSFKLFDRGLELFKARRINNRKSFRLDELPESFRLLSSAGRGTIHQVGATRLLVEMLANHNTAAEVVEAYRRLDWKDWLDALGPRGFETLCLGYLIQEKGFVPTGIAIGGTLADFDIVGRNKAGARILAQCKKSPAIYRLSNEEIAAYTQSSKADVYLFAYNDAIGAPKHVTVISGKDIQDWFARTSRGKEYLKLLTT